MGGTPQEIERRLDAGEWLLPGDVAILLGVGRKTVDRMLTSNVIHHKKKPGSGRYRECDPIDVRRILAERRTVHPPAEPTQDPHVIRPNPETPTDHSASPTSGSQPPRPAGSDGHDR